MLSCLFCSLLHRLFHSRHWTCHIRKGTNVTSIVNDGSIKLVCTNSTSLELEHLKGRQATIVICHMCSAKLNCPLWQKSTAWITVALWAPDSVVHVVLCNLFLVKLISFAILNICNECVYMKGSFIPCHRTNYSLVQLSNWFPKVAIQCTSQFVLCQIKLYV